MNDMLNNSSYRNYQPHIQQYNLKPSRDYSDVQCEQTGMQAGDIRLVSLESRVETLEKMLHFYDELLKLKEEERKNEYQLDIHKLSDMTNKIGYLEGGLSSLSKKINDHYNSLNNIIDSIQAQKPFTADDIKAMVINILNENKQLAYVSKDEQIPQSTRSRPQETMSHNVYRKQNDEALNDYLSEKIADLEALINKNNIVNENCFDDKLSSIQSQFDNKMTDILSVIQDLNKITETNEFNITEFKETIRGIQNDNVELMKIISLQKEKGKQIDYILEQITDLKGKYSKLLQIFNDNQKEEDIFLQNYLSGDKQND